MRKVVVVLSGGWDSMVLLHWHIKNGDTVRAVGVNYGQRHKCELLYAARECARLNVPFVTVHLPDLFELMPGLCLLNAGLVPTGELDMTARDAIVIPNRNMILLALALAHAAHCKFDGVSYAAHTSKVRVDPDCRPEFAEALNEAAKLCDYHKVEIFRPFVAALKTDICRFGARLGVSPASTYSCFVGGEKHCGKCQACQDRITSFQLAGVADNTEYAHSH